MTRLSFLVTLAALCSCNVEPTLSKRPVITRAVAPALTGTCRVCLDGRLDACRDMRVLGCGEAVDAGWVPAREWEVVR